MSTSSVNKFPFPAPRDPETPCPGLLLFPRRDQSLAIRLGPAAAFPFPAFIPPFLPRFSLLNPFFPRISPKRSLLAKWEFSAFAQRGWEGTQSRRFPLDFGFGGAGIKGGAALIPPIWPGMRSCIPTPQHPLPPPGEEGSFCPGNAGPEPPLLQHNPAQAPPKS